MSKPRLEAVIFDIDGTLVDSNDLHARCWQETFEQFGHPLAYDTIRMQIGKGGDLLVPDLLNAREMKQFGDQLKEERSKLFKKKYMDQVKPFPWAHELLQELHDRKIRLVFASSANEDEVDHYKALLQAKDLLESSTSKKDAKLSKPSPEIFEAAVERLGGSNEGVIVVGDTPYDVLAAHRCALPIVAVLSGGFTPDLLMKAEWLFRDANQLLQRTEQIDAYFQE